MRRLTLCAVLGAGLLLSVYLPASAAVIVDFNSTAYVSSNQPFARSWQSEGGTDMNGDGDGADSFIPFSTSTALSPAANYSGPTFYGGWISEGTPDLRGNTGVADHTDGDAGDNDSIIVVELEQTDRGAVAFLKNDFLAAGPVSFDATSSVLFEASALYGNSEIRLLVRDGTTWYVGETDLGSSATMNPASENWAAFALAEGDKKIEFTGSSYPVAGTSFTDITAVGMYHVNGTRSESGISRLTVDAVVPEPATMVLLGLGGAAALIRRKK